MKKVKLSVAQQQVMDRAYEDVRRARECDTVEEWFNKYNAIHYNCNYNTPEKQKANDAERWERVIVGWYNRNRDGIVLTSCSSKTLAKLEKLGLIEIIEDSNGQHYGIDVVRVLGV